MIVTVSIPADSKEQKARPVRVKIMRPNLSKFWYVINLTNGAALNKHFFESHKEAQEWLLGEYKELRKN